MLELVKNNSYPKLNQNVDSTVIEQTEKALLILDDLFHRWYRQKLNQISEQSLEVLKTTAEERVQIYRSIYAIDELSSLLQAFEKAIHSFPIFSGGMPLSIQLIMYPYGLKTAEGVIRELKRSRSLKKYNYKINNYVWKQAVASTKLSGAFQDILRKYTPAATLKADWTEYDLSTVGTVKACLSGVLKNCVNDMCQQARLQLIQWAYKQEIVGIESPARDIAVKIG